jgi:hypothetical protein
LAPKLQLKLVDGRRRVRVMRVAAWFLGVALLVGCGVDAPIGADEVADVPQALTDTGGPALDADAPDLVPITDVTAAEPVDAESGFEGPICWSNAACAPGSSCFRQDCAVPFGHCKSQSWLCTQVGCRFDCSGKKWPSLCALVDAGQTATAAACDSAGAGTPFDSQAALNQAFAVTPCADPGATGPAEAITPTTFAAPSASVCGKQDPNVPPPEIDLATSSSCFGTGQDCKTDFYNACKGYCAKDGKCHQQFGGLCYPEVHGDGFYTPVGVCDISGCVTAKIPPSTSDVLGKAAPGPLLHDNNPCWHGVYRYAIKQWPLFTPIEYFSAPRSPIDDNPCTTDACDSCSGMSHLPASGSCRVGTACGTCSAGTCSAISSAAIFDVTLPQIALSKLRMTAAGGFIGQADGAEPCGQHGLLRADASGKVVAQIWTALPLVLGPGALSNGDLVASTRDAKATTTMAVRFDGNTLQPLAPPLASSTKSAESIPRSPVIQPYDVVAISASDLGAHEAWHGYPPLGNFEPDWSVNLFVANKGVKGIVVQTPVASGWWPSVDPYARAASELMSVPALVKGSGAALMGPAKSDVWSPAVANAPDGFGLVDGIDFAPSGAIVGWGRWNGTVSKSVALWLTADASKVNQIVFFDELPEVADLMPIPGAVLANGGVAIQAGRAIAWTNANGDKIGYALIPDAQNGMRMFGVAADGSIGLVSPSGHRVARIPWDWSAPACP